MADVLTGLTTWRRGRGVQRTAPRLVDAVLVGMLTVLLAWPGRDGVFAVAPLLITVPLAGRHRWPLVCFALQLFGVFLTHSAATSPVALVALAIGAYSATGFSGRRGRALAALGSLVAVLLIHFAVGRGPIGVVLVAVWLLGTAGRSLWLRARTAEQYAQALQREQRTAQELAIETERARIARELHDVLGHNVSVMMIQAGAARQAVTESPQAIRALLEVEAAGRQAMSDLRHLLRLLGPDATDPYTADDDTPLSPPPSLAHLDALVARMCNAGLPVHLHREGPPQPVEPGVDLAAYRVIQEGLTNALKYAGGAPTDVTVCYEPGGLRVAVLDRGGPVHSDARDGSGRGLLGLRERVALYQGEFKAGRRAGGGYQVRAHFPLDSR